MPRRSCRERTVPVMPPEDATYGKAADVAPVAYVWPGPWESNKLFEVWFRRSNLIGLEDPAWEAAPPEVTIEYHRLFVFTLREHDSAMAGCAESRTLSTLLSDSRLLRLDTVTS